MTSLETLLHFERVESSFGTLTCEQGFRLDILVKDIFGFLIRLETNFELI